jgi:hypothetical protein
MLTIETRIFKRLWSPALYSLTHLVELCVKCRLEGAIHIPHTQFRPLLIWCLMIRQ